MNNNFRKLATMLILTVFLIMLAAPLHAQDDDDEFTCDDGPNDALNAAQTAIDNEDRDTAWTLAAQAEALCVNDLTRFLQAQRLRRRLDLSIGEMIDNAEPGRVDVGDYELFMYCLGKGSPTVIFENGLSLTSLSSWEDVLPAVSTVTRACRYDRLGSPPSRLVPTGMVRTTQDQVDDLLAVLEIAEIEPPLVLVGHSIGGLNISLLVDQHPDLVEGIVLVDATHPQNLLLHAEANPDLERPVPGEGASNERLDLATSFAQVPEVPDFGDRPLAVVTAGIGPSSTDPIWQELQEAFATYSSNSLHVVAERGNHVVMDNQPEIVIEAILWVLDELNMAQDQSSEGE